MDIHRNKPIGAIISWNISWLFSVIYPEIRKGGLQNLFTLYHLFPVSIPVFLQQTDSLLFQHLATISKTVCWQ